MTTSWATKMEDVFIKKGDHEGLLKAGIAWDVFGLCPEYAVERNTGTVARPIGGATGRASATRRKIFFGRHNAPSGPH